MPPSSPRARWRVGQDGKLVLRQEEDPTRGKASQSVRASKQSASHRVGQWIGSLGSSWPSTIVLFWEVFGSVQTHVELLLRPQGLAIRDMAAPPDVVMEEQGALSERCFLRAGGSTGVAPVAPHVDS